MATIFDLVRKASKQVTVPLALLTVMGANALASAPKAQAAMFEPTATSQTIGMRENVNVVSKGAYQATIFPDDADNENNYVFVSSNAKRFLVTIDGNNQRVSIKTIVALRGTPLPAEVQFKLDSSLSLRGVEFNFENMNYLDRERNKLLVRAADLNDLSPEIAVVRQEVGAGLALFAEFNSHPMQDGFYRTEQFSNGTVIGGLQSGDARTKITRNLRDVMVETRFMAPGLPNGFVQAVKMRKDGRDQGAHFDDILMNMVGRWSGEFNLSGLSLEQKLALGRPILRRVLFDAAALSGPNPLENATQNGIYILGGNISILDPEAKGQSKGAYMAEILNGPRESFDIMAPGAPGAPVVSPTAKQPITHFGKIAGFGKLTGASATKYKTFAELQAAAHQDIERFEAKQKAPPPATDAFKSIKPHELAPSAVVMTLKDGLPLYKLNEPTHALGTLPVGSSLTILQEGTDTAKNERCFRVLVTDPKGGPTTEGQVREEDIMNKATLVTPAGALPLPSGVGPQSQNVVPTTKTNSGTGLPKGTPRTILQSLGFKF